MHTNPKFTVQHFIPITSSPEIHSMGDSLERYLKMKVHPALLSDKLIQVNIMARFDRSEGISPIEKADKLFNFMRPTAIIDNDMAEVRCFPGYDYIYHYTNIIKTYYAMNHINTAVLFSFPTEQECSDAIRNSMSIDIPIVDTVIMGYVEGLDYISNDKEWDGKGSFLWKHVKIKSGNAILLGCKHTYWGEIAGRIVDYLAIRGAKCIIYSGKLGTLNPALAPNQIIATGQSSVLYNGVEIEWCNIFENVKTDNIIHGTHITVPSVLQETRKWVEDNYYKYFYVDPEIGHMALAAKRNRIQFSYLHVVSDNVSTNYLYDLSNERQQKVLFDRQRLLQQIGQLICEL